jgi:ribosomal protein L18E
MMSELDKLIQQLTNLNKQGHKSVTLDVVWLLSAVTAERPQVSARTQTGKINVDGGEF